MSGNASPTATRLLRKAAHGGSGGGRAWGGGIWTNGDLANTTVSDSRFTHNQAVGGSGGNGQGGGLEGETKAVLTIANSSFGNNLALGGTGAVGQAGGQGRGGGLFINDTASLTLTNATVTANQATGGAGGSDGPGIGGGVYLADAAHAAKDALTTIFANLASTSDDGIGFAFQTAALAVAACSARAAVAALGPVALDDRAGHTQRRAEGTVETARAADAAAAAGAARAGLRDVVRDLTSDDRRLRRVGTDQPAAGRIATRLDLTQRELLALISGVETHLGAADAVNGVPTGPIRIEVRAAVTHRFGRWLTGQLSFTWDRYVPTQGWSNIYSTKWTLRLGEAFRLWSALALQHDVPVDQPTPGVQPQNSGLLTVGAEYTF